MTQKFSTNKDWETPRLIARLQDSQRISSVWNPAVSGRSTPMDKIRSVLEFAYMGNSEFEFGTTRHAVDNLQAYIDRNKVAPLVVPVVVGLRPAVDVYALAPRKYHNAVHSFLNSTEYWRTPEPTYFQETLAGLETSRYGAETKGWFDLRNQVLFFVDRETCEKMRVALGVKTPLPVMAADSVPVIPVKSQVHAMAPGPEAF